MVRPWTVLMLVGLLGNVAHAALPGLDKVDRTIAREPAYQETPGYCLLVFGPQADVRVWLVRDGKTLHVDRNANGDLTEPGERIKAGRERSFQTSFDGKASSYREIGYSVGDLAPAGGQKHHTNFEITIFGIDGEPTNVVLSLLVNGNLKQYAGWKPLFAANRSAAPIIHFGGPMIVRPLRGATVKLSDAHPEVHLCFGTPGLGAGSFAFLGYEAVPGTVHPRIEIEWPCARPGATPVRTSAVLPDRC